MSADDANERLPSDPGPEPVHPPPIRGLRAMAAVRWIILVLVAAVAVGTWWRYALRDGAEGDQRPDRFFCPMHPQIRSPDPGSCPICYMTLEPIPDGSQGAAAPAEVADAGAEEPTLAPVMLTTERRQRAGVSTVAVRSTTLPGTARWPASVEVREGARAEVRVRAPGFIERLAIRQVNEDVRAGQPLAWVYSPELLRAQEELLVAHRWSASGGPAPSELAATEAAARERLVLLGMSEREVDAVVASGRSTRTVAVRAPVAGTITRFEAARGGYATPEALLFEIIDFSGVRVVASPFGADVSWLRESERARFLPRGDRAAVELRFERVEPRVIEPTRAWRVRFAPTGPAALLAEEIGEVVIEGPSRVALVVPRDAVIDTGLRRYVFVDRGGGLFEPRPVELGPLQDEVREIVSGLTEGERVVARGAFLLDSESRLQAALAPATGGPVAPPATGHEGMDMGGTP